MKKSTQPTSRESNLQDIISLNVADGRFGPSSSRNIPNEQFFLDNQRENFIRSLSSKESLREEMDHHFSNLSHSSLNWTQGGTLQHQNTNLPYSGNNMNVHKPTSQRFQNEENTSTIHPPINHQQQLFSNFPHQNKRIDNTALTTSISNSAINDTPNNNPFSHNVLSSNNSAEDNRINSVFNLSELLPQQRQLILSKLATVNPENLNFIKLDNGEIIVNYKSSGKPSDIDLTNILTPSQPSPNSLLKIQNSIQTLSTSSEHNLFKDDTQEEKKIQPRSLDWLLRFIEDVYNSRYTTFLNEISSPDGTLETFSSFVFNHISKKFGLDRLVRQISSQLLESVKIYRKSNKNVELFGLFLSPYYSAIDLMFFLNARSKALLVAQNQKNQKLPTKKKLKVGIDPQYIMSSKVKSLTHQILSSQPTSLRKSCMKDLKTISDVSKVTPTNLLSSKQREQIRSKQITMHAPSHASKLPKLSKIELYEYLIILLIHYKAFKDSKDDSGSNYYFTILPEDVPSYSRTKLSDLVPFVSLREVSFDEATYLDKSINNLNIVNIECEFSWRQKNLIRLQQQIENEKFDYDKELRNLYSDFTSPSRSPLSVHRELLKKSQKNKSFLSSSSLEASDEIDSSRDDSPGVELETQDNIDNNTFFESSLNSNITTNQSENLGNESSTENETEEELWLQKQNRILRDKLAKLETEEVSYDDELDELSKDTAKLTNEIRNILSSTSKDDKTTKLSASPKNKIFTTNRNDSSPKSRKFNLSPTRRGSTSPKTFKNQPSATKNDQTDIESLQRSKSASPSRTRLDSKRNLRSQSPNSQLSPKQKDLHPSQIYKNTNLKVSTKPSSPYKNIYSSQKKEESASPSSPKQPSQTFPKDLNNQLKNESKSPKSPKFGRKRPMIPQELSTLLSNPSLPDHFVTGDMSQEMDADPTYLFESSESPISQSKEINDDILRVRRDITRQLLDNIESDEEEYEVSSDSSGDENYEPKRQ